ncbi:MAG: TIGR04283 family arsenosugar biosynthesis glycosyltransferase [Thermodesulfobacteriota bacterium]|nr:TIGR04283 family arsenosugar biosynthesis glycosyltransferase [Thermodesulfobacteriota bacterium]
MLPSRKSLSQDRVIIFSRYPVPGRTKTRLIPTFGPVGAADLHRRLTEKTFDTVSRFAEQYHIDMEIRFDGGSKRKIQRWLKTRTILSHQGHGDLGERMNTAFIEAFQRGCRHVILLGTDIPGVTGNHLKNTMEALLEYDLVLGPSTDGGYWLIGMKNPGDVFQGIDWGTEKVLQQTMTSARGQDLKVHLLDPLTDVDTVEDLNRVWPEENGRSPYISVIIPTLNESENIESTIHTARNKDAEIIVVDGGSTDDTVKRAEATGVRVERSSCGRALQQNRGAQIARGHVLLFLHADTSLPDSYANNIFDALMDPEVSFGAFLFKTDMESPLMRVIECAANIRSRYLKLPYGDQGLFLCKSMFTKIGGFPDVAIAEDLFFARLLGKQGSVCIVPACAITSARRWRNIGLLRTTIVNYVIAAGCYLGIPPYRLAFLYRIPGKK